MPTWRDLHDAPRDKRVWLFLPSSKFEADANGRPLKVEHEVVLAQWQGDHSAWMADRRVVYPSLWSDADPAGVPPESPL
jgi:hypothetical protein